jgi:O-methyltransferase involved in polyketide biosynthesis
MWHDVGMTAESEAALGAVQRTLFFPLLARAKETARKRPLLRDRTAVEMVHAIDFDYSRYETPFAGFMVVIRTMILDGWVRQFLADHPGGTVVELGTGLNTRFERTDNGSVHWIDLDLPDTIALRRRFFADNPRRRMVAASLLDEDWRAEVEQVPGPYFFVSDGVLTYLAEQDVTGALSGIAARFPGAWLAFDTYSRRSLEGEHKMAAKRDIARWQWACDDPRALEPLGLRLVETATLSRPPAGVRAQLPARYRYPLRAADPLLRGLGAVSLFQAGR